MGSRPFLVLFYVQIPCRTTACRKRTPVVGCIGVSHETYANMKTNSVDIREAIVLKATETADKQSHVH
jgi:hypothetical protein